MSNRHLNVIFANRDLLRGTRLVALALANRADDAGTCYPSVATLASDCMMTTRQVRRGIRELAAAGMLVIETSQGMATPHGPTNRYRLTLENTPTSGVTPTSPGDAHVTPLRVTPMSPGDTGGSGGVTLETARGDTHVSQTPREPPNGTPSKKRAPKWSPEVVEQIYQSYPRRVAKGAALVAIAKALDRLSKQRDDAPAWLLQRVKQYGLERQGEDPKFTPHAATWFNQERYFDDPAPANRRGGAANGLLPVGHEDPDRYADLDSRAIVCNGDL